MNVSATTFIRNAFQGGFPVFESMATMLALPIEEFVIVDMGSNDGTLEYLTEMALYNPRIRLEVELWSKIDASAFADIANRCVELCETDSVLFYQADEVWHQTLLPMIEVRWVAEEYDLSFWRIQLKRNFQEIKWWPHLVHRCIRKGESTYVGDGMNTDRTWDAKLCSDYHGGWMQRWYTDFVACPEKLPWDNFVFDIHASFDLNMIGWRKLHAPFWRESEDVIEGMGKSAWIAGLADPVLKAKTAPFSLPNVLKGCVGMGKYELRDKLAEALIEDEVQEVIHGDALLP
tara:strand:+ start:2634 stop:3500 length:867 start_codon:yes stop_codon:yes gene_type:complete